VNFKLRLKVNILDIIGRRLLIFKVWEPDITDIFLKNLKTAELFIDVGAHWGYYSVLFALESSPDAQVYSIEPNPKTFRVLQNNVTLNDLGSKITLISAALGRTQGSGHLQPGKKENSGNSKLSEIGIKVDIDCLDNSKLFPRKKVSIVKVDVEGSEYDVLEGGSCFIQEMSEGSLLILEVSRGHLSITQKGENARKVVAGIREYKQVLEVPTFFSFSAYYESVMRKSLVKRKWHDSETMNLVFFF
jgi:FkbM family methyltransferase